jgi:hypothetical protein
LCGWAPAICASACPLGSSQTCQFLPDEESLYLEVVSYLIGTPLIGNLHILSNDLGHAFRSALSIAGSRKHRDSAASLHFYCRAEDAHFYVDIRTHLYLRVAPFSTVLAPDIDANPSTGFGCNHTDHTFLCRFLEAPVFQSGSLLICAGP